MLDVADDSGPSNMEVFLVNSDVDACPPDNATISDDDSMPPLYHPD